MRSVTEAMRLLFMYGRNNRTNLLVVYILLPGRKPARNLNEIVTNESLAIYIIFFTPYHRLDKSEMIEETLLFLCVCFVLLCVVFIQFGGITVSRKHQWLS